MFKYCHSCGGEFQLAASVCPDCNEPLRLEPPQRREPATPMDSAAPLEDPVLLKIGEPWELRELAESLQAHGISSQIDTYPLGGSLAGNRAGRGQPARLGIYVARADLDAVREFAAELAESALPDGDDDGSHDAATCPACGEPTPENSAACASCGLEFPEIEGGR